MTDEGLPAITLPSVPNAYDADQMRRAFRDIEQWMQEVDAALNRRITSLSVGLNLIEVQTASSSASLDFSTSIDSTYDEYVFMVEYLIPATDAADVWLRTSTDGGFSYDASASDYGWALTTNGTAFTSSADTKMAMTVADVGSDANETGYCGWVYLTAPSDAVYTRVQHHGSYVGTDGVLDVVHGAGSRLSADNVNAIQFLYSSGNIESGTIRLYGVTAS